MRIALTCVFAVSLFSCKITTDEPDTFTVAFDANGGSGSIESITKTENEEFELPANTFTRTGYTFAGWNTKSTPDESGKSYKNKEKIKLTEDLTLYAQWAAGTGTAYKVEHWQQNIADDGYTLAKTEPMTGTTGEKTAAKAEETAGFSAKEFVQAKIAADGSTVIKIWYDRKIITLTFDADNGGEKTVVSGRFGVEIISPFPEKTDFNFNGWSTEKIPNESSKLYNGKEKIMLTEDLTLYAQWKENPSYSINYNLNEGTNPEDARTSYKQDETVVLPVPTREFYDFAGWHLAQDFSGEVIKGWNAGEKTDAVTLYAKWAVKAENVMNAIKNLTAGSHTVCVTGEIDETTVENIGKALRSNENVKVNLDLSGTSGLEIIPLGAFEGCTNLTGIKIPASVKSIDDDAFRECTSLTTIEIPESVTSIGNRTFVRCTNLANIKIPESVTSIGNSTFVGCINLTNIAIPASVTSIGEAAFVECTSLTTIEIPESVANIGVNAFTGCRNVIQISISNENEYYQAFNNCIYTKDGQTLIAILGSPMDITEDFYLPTITKIDELVFQDGAVINLEIPEGVVSIEDSAFVFCENLVSVKIPKSLKSVNSLAFYGCTNLTTVNYNGTIAQWNDISGHKAFGSRCKIICTDGVINGD